MVPDRGKRWRDFRAGDPAIRVRNDGSQRPSRLMESNSFEALEWRRETAAPFFSCSAAGKSADILTRRRGATNTTAFLKMLNRVAPRQRPRGLSTRLRVRVNTRPGSFRPRVRRETRAGMPSKSARLSARGLRGFQKKPEIPRNYSYRWHQAYFTIDPVGHWQWALLWRREAAQSPP